MCFTCHGADGNSKNPNFPILAGQKPAYLVNQLRAFRKGTRKNGMMQNMAANLNDAEINNLAAFFASVQNISAGGAVCSMTSKTHPRLFFTRCNIRGSKGST
jgi:cytochrome c553